MSALLSPSHVDPPTGGSHVHHLPDVLDAELRPRLDELARRSHAQLDGPDGIGVTVLVEGRSVFAGSNPFTDKVDQIQYGLGQGPCLSAVDSRKIVRSRSIGTGESRWERFTAQAAALGLRSVTSVPVRASGQVVGSLNLYGRHATTFDALDTVALLRHAELVAQATLSASLLAAATMTAEVFTAAVRDREDIDIAVGLLMDRYAMTASHARILITQLAVQDQVSEPDAARSLTDPVPGRRG